MGLGFFRKLKDLGKKVVKVAKKVVPIAKKVWGVAAPFVSKIPKFGSAIATGVNTGLNIASGITGAKNTQQGVQSVINSVSPFIKLKKNTGGSPLGPMDRNAPAPSVAPAPAVYSGIDSDLGDGDMGI